MRCPAIVNSESAMKRLSFLLALFWLPIAAAAADPFKTVWAHDFEVRAQPSLMFFSRDQLAVTDDGRPVFGHRSLLRSDPVRNDLVFRGPGPEDFFQTFGQAHSPFVHRLQASGNRIFALYSTTTDHCAVAEVGANQLLWTTDLDAEGGRCVTLDITSGELHVITDAGYWFRLDQQGNVLSRLSLGSSEPIGGAIIRALPSGDVLTFEVPGPVGGGFFRLARRSVLGQVIWSRVEGFNSGEAIDLQVSSSGVYTLVFHAGDPGHGRYHVWRGNMDGTAPTTQSIPSEQGSATGVCIVGDEVRHLRSDNTDYVLDRLAPASGLVSTVIQGLRGNRNPQLACLGHRMFVMAPSSMPEESLRVHEINETGTLWSRDFPDNSGQHLAFRATSNGVYAATMAYSPDGIDRWTLRRFGLDGTPDLAWVMPDKRVESVPFDLSGSRAGDPVLVTRHGHGLHLVSVDHTIGARWARPLRARHSFFGTLANDFYAVRRNDLGGVDVVGAALDFFRFDADGNEYFRMPVGSTNEDDPELHYAPNGDVVVRAGPTSVYRIRDNEIPVSTVGTYAARVDALNRVDVMSMELFPQSQSVMHRLDAAFQPIPASRRVFPDLLGDWILHENGVMDFISGRSVHRYLQSGELVFFRTHDAVPTGHAEIRSVADPIHGIVSIWVDRSVSPETFQLVRTDKDGNLVWYRPLPYRVDSLAMDENGIVGVAGSRGNAAFALLIDAEGGVVFERTCNDDRFCDQSVSAIGSEGGRWFIAGTQTAPTEYTRRTYVAEIERPLLRSSFESGEP